ncbi:hypothetical protein CSOJ01_14255 [Colletotrichum sojae]|uniref:Uncharacterized protein n=1 Tax=Colletotrichum sojae TaxID=2175907 RepID=A0A8H6IR35_9PEZI|nr:hypothetical protein CSOJ01_14255 [Colletotrichum sojae]
MAHLLEGSRNIDKLNGKILPTASGMKTLLRGIAHPDPGNLRLFASDTLASDTDMPARIQWPILFTDSANAYTYVMNPLNEARARHIGIRYKLEDGPTEPGPPVSGTMLCLT